MFKHTRKILLASSLICILIAYMMLAGCVYQNVTLNTLKTLDDGTRVEMTSRTVNFAFSQFINDGIAKVVGLFVKTSEIETATKAIQTLTPPPLPPQPVTEEYSVVPADELYRMIFRRTSLRTGSSPVQWL